MAGPIGAAITPVPVPPEERGRRARAVLAGPRGYYGLGAGGRDPSAALPWGAYQPRASDPLYRVKLRAQLGKVWCDCLAPVADSEWAAAGTSGWTDEDAIVDITIAADGAAGRHVVDFERQRARVKLVVTNPGTAVLSPTSPELP